MTVIYAIIFFGLLIFVHELGHFIFAKLNGVEVKEFSIGFGPAIFKFRRGFTVYKIGIIFFGGYVRMVGEMPEEENLPGSFQTKKPWVKILIAFAGSFFNYIMAVLVFIALYIVGYYAQEPVVGEVMNGYPAEKGGLKVGDVIVRVNDIKISFWSQISAAIEKYGEDEIEVEVRRGDKSFVFRLKPVKEEFESEGRKITKFVIGIKPDPEKKKRVRASFFKGIYYGVLDSIFLTGEICKGIWFMIVGKVSWRDIRSPIYIFKEAGEAARESKREYLFLLAIISINLAIFNLLPIPILDGGMIVIALFEWIMRRKAPEKLVIALKLTGLLIIFFILTMAIYNDIVDIILKK